MFDEDDVTVVERLRRVATDGALGSGVTAGRSGRSEVDFEWTRDSAGSLMTNLSGDVGSREVDPDATGSDLVRRAGGGDSSRSAARTKLKLGDAFVTGGGTGCDFWLDRVAGRDLWTGGVAI